MMFAANTDATIQISPTNAGVGFVPSLIQMRVEGPSGIIQDWVTLLNLGESADPSVPSIPAIGSNDAAGLIVKVAASFNTLGVGNVKEARLISLRMSSAGVTAPVIQTVEYIISDGSIEADGLVVGTNSFQSYPEALIVADTMGDLNGWDGTDYAGRVRAMQQSYYFLSRLSYEILYDQEDVYFKNRASWGLPYINTIGNLAAYSKDQYLGLDEYFRAALCKAQICEASEILTVDPMASLREGGVTQQVVGDTSVTFRAGTAPLKLTVSKRTLSYLQGYVKYSPKLSRV
jgi:hypothetical protein